MTKVESQSMPAESPESRTEALAWLEGLAGRDAPCEVSEEGAKLRGALLDESAGIDPPDWSQIAQMANSRPKPLVYGVSVSAESGADLRKVASNEPAFRYRYGWAAGIALCCVMLIMQWPTTQDDDGAQMRGAGESEAIYRTAAPAEDANALAAALRALGAVVVVQATANGMHLDIRAEPHVAVAVNQRLEVMETGLDTRGRLILRLLPLKP